MRAFPTSAALAAAALLALLASPFPVAAQGAPEGAAAPSLPQGEGAIRGRVVHKRTQEGQAGIDVALYALQPDGSPGVGGTTSGPDGSFLFTGLSADPSVVYLLGARFRDVPFGRRVRFPEGGKALEVDIEIDESTRDPAALALEASRIVVDWMGTELLLTERLRLRNTGDQVINVQGADREGAEPILEIELPPGAHSFQTGFESFGQELELLPDGRLVHWGPVFPGEQELLYQYRLTTPPAESTAMEIIERFPRGVGEVEVLIANTGMEARLHSLAEGEDQEIEGRSYKVLQGGPLAPGETIELSLALPELRSDPNALSLARSDHWLELDDASLLVSAEQQLSVEPGARLVGSPESPLVSFRIPERAEIVGITNQAASLGVRPSEQGIDVLGPLGPGTSTIAYRYRLPVRPSGTQLDIDFPLPAALVNVLVADTGVEVSSERLHRQRPFRNGTRVYLHREGFQVQPDEGVRVRVRPLVRGGIPAAGTLGAAVAALALAAWFVATPLLGRADSGPKDETSGTLDERERVYETIRDLDHDFETGKIAEADYVEMRGALRKEAVELIRAEKQSGASVDVPAAVPNAAADADRAPPAAVPAEKGVFCPACGQRADPGWKFCSACGGALPEAGD